MIKTVQNSPNDEIVGSYFAGPNTKHDGKGAIYYCDSYHSSLGYWMTSITEPGYRSNVSERAIGNTFHTIFSYGKGYKSRWGVLKEFELQLIDFHMKQIGHRSIHLIA